MNKKLIAGIIAAAVALAVAIILIITLSGKSRISLKKDKETKKETSSASDTKSPEKEDSNEKGGETNVSFGTTETKKDTIETPDVVVKKGVNSVNVPIYVNNNDGMCAARVFVTFDTKYFSYSNVTEGDIFSDCVGNFKDGKVTLVLTTGDDIHNVKGAGVAANLVLTPKSNTPAGTYEVKVEKESEFANNNDQFVKPEVKAANIIIQ